MMIAFVDNLEKDPVIEQLDAFNGGPTDRIVGKTGKVGARFDPGGQSVGQSWVYGKNGVPLEFSEKSLILRRQRTWEEAVEHAQSLLKEIFGDYFLPEDVD
jgi:hypothetical protein